MSKFEDLKDEGEVWWRNLKERTQGIFIGMAIVLVLLGVSSLVGCPSRTMSVIEKKLKAGVTVLTKRQRKRSKRKWRN